MTLVGIDLGTTRCKAALFDRQGDLLRSASFPTPVDRSGEAATLDPDRLWQVVMRLLTEIADHDHPTVIGVTGMAEAGVLVERATGAPRTPIIAWFDTRSTGAAEEIGGEESLVEQFARSGLHPSYKYGLSKIVWLREIDADIARDAVWLSVPDYIAFRLTGDMATDPTLAARTYAYRILEGCWDGDWLARLGLDIALFPRVLPSGVPAGAVSSWASACTGIVEGVPVAVSGHDHICALLAAGIVEPGPVLDSMGTAESLLTVATEPKLGPAERASGLALVPHVLPGRYCWLGGLSAAGGSIEWLRGLTGTKEEAMYERMQQEVEALDDGPSAALYFPYLLGSGAPNPDRRVRGAFVGLDMGDARAAVYKALLQGLAFEAESVLHTVETAAGHLAEDLIAVGGGAHNHLWLQAKATTAGRPYHVPALTEAAALGAAVTAGLGSGTLSGVGEIVDIAVRHRISGFVVEPDERWVPHYRQVYERRYLPLLAALHADGRIAAETTDEPESAPDVN